MPRLFLLFALGIAGTAPLASSCSSSSIEVPREVLVQVPVACVAERPARPATRSIEALLALGRYERTLAAWADRLRLEGYLAELEAQLEACARLP